ncbi:MAG TPA: GDSL-type esterase/lipase family protein, partial [Gemmata sp.]|nr:GDSL-type esterase/lipase family protein [Gemmata sp.]
KEGLPKFEKGLEKLLDALASAKARIVLFTPMPFEKHKRFPDFKSRNEGLEEYAEVIRKIAEKRQFYLADLFQIGNKIFTKLDEIRQTRTDLWKESLTENGMHLSESGYYSMAVPLFLRSLGSDEKMSDKIYSLSEAVVEKNQLFFYRWRPQNETYLFGFRKHEQGKNGKEVAEFDPLVGKAEEEIERLKKELLK